MFAAWCRHRGNFRRDNEDSIWVGPADAAAEVPPDMGTADLHTGGPGMLAVVCDGVGGGAAGEVASALAVRSFVGRLRESVTHAPAGDFADPLARVEWMKRAVACAHAEILAAVERDHALEGMGTTLTAVWCTGSDLHLAQVGDSRLYRLRLGRLEQISQDQSLVGRMRRDGALTEEQARRHPLRNIVDQVVGGSDRGVGPTMTTVAVRAGDEFLLCSDGLTDGLTDAALERKLVAGLRMPPQAVTAGLLENVLEIAGRDNISIILLRPFSRRGSLVRVFGARAGRFLRPRSESQETPREGLPGEPDPPAADGTAS